MTHPELEAYLRRISLVGPIEPSLPTLRALVQAHVAAIPFENLNPFLGLPVSLDPVAVFAKLVTHHRGGYCFEQNLLLLDALETIGFTAWGLAARVLWRQSEEAITPRGHMLLRVEIAGCSHVVDVGFGGMTLTGVLRLETEVEQPTPHETFRLRSRDGDWFLQAWVRDSWQTLYRFDLQRQYRVDYAAANYYLSTYPESHFRTGLLVARSSPGLRLALRNAELARHRADGSTDRTVLVSPQALRQTLEQEFGLRLPDVPQLDRRLDALIPRT
jgi:N-hydroxyarylamine O-acetyltransferase